MYSPPTDAERLALFRALLAANCAARGERRGVAVTRRHATLLGPRLELESRQQLYRADTLVAVDDHLAKLAA